MDSMKSRPTQQDVGQRPRVASATVREAQDETGWLTWHIECRFEDGQKYAPVIVDHDREDLARAIADFLTAGERK